LLHFILKRLLAITFVLRRLLAAIPVLAGVVFCVVAATRLIPGSPASMKSERLSKAEIAALDHKYGWDRPLLVQYGLYVERALFHGDLGDCWMHDTSVAEELETYIPATIELAAAAMLLATVLGVGLGMFAAVRPRGIVDYVTMTGALVGVSLPVFWLGILLQIAIAPVQFRVDPVTVLPEDAHFYVLHALVTRDGPLLIEVLEHLALPAIALATIPLATIARITRTSLMEALAQDYVRTARAKGLSNTTVVLKHALRNALIPIVTASGLQLAQLLGGAVLTETVFAWPGIGKYIFEAATNKDLPALQGAVLVVAIVFLVANFAVDVSYALIDPRLRRT
jgi:peptide/nickel transport system permease protein